MKKQNKKPTKQTKIPSPVKMESPSEVKIQKRKKKNKIEKEAVASDFTELSNQKDDMKKQNKKPTKKTKISSPVNIQNRKTNKEPYNYISEMTVKIYLLF